MSDIDRMRTAEPTDHDAKACAETPDGELSMDDLDAVAGGIELQPLQFCHRDRVGMEERFEVEMPSMTYP